VINSRVIHEVNLVVDSILIQLAHSLCNYCLSVCPSVTLMYRRHMSWVSSVLIRELSKKIEIVWKCVKFEIIHPQGEEIRLNENGS